MSEHSDQAKASEPETLIQQVARVIDGADWTEWAVVHVSLLRGVVDEIARLNAELERSVSHYLAMKNRVQEQKAAHNARRVIMKQGREAYTKAILSIKELSAENTRLRQLLYAALAEAREAGNPNYPQGGE